MSREYRNIKLYEKEIFELKAKELTKKEIGEKLGFTKEQVRPISIDYGVTDESKIAYLKYILTRRKEVKPSAKYNVIYQHKNEYSISEMCRFFSVCRSVYYDCVKRIDVRLILSK